MALFRRSRIVLFVALTLVLCLTVATVSAVGPPKRRVKKMSVGDISFLGMATFATGTTFADTEIGGFSGIAYDEARDVYYVLSDDRSEEAPSRYYTVAINTSGAELEVTFLDVTFLRDESGELFEPLAIDPESIVLTRSGQLLISTEGDDDTMPLSDPEIMRFDLAGGQTGSLPVPDKFLYSVDDGNHVRDNLGFESLTLAPHGKFLFAATENALINDGPISTLDNGSPARFLQYLLPRSKPMREFIYCVDPIPQAPVPVDAFADHGLVEIDALDNAGTFLTMERSFAVGVGNTILLFEATTRGATNVSRATALHLDGCPQGKFRTMHKELLVDLEADLGVAPDNVEAMTFGPELADGRRLLILVSDNNFNPSQITQFIALAVEMERH